MINYSNYKVYRHSLDEQLNCFGWSCYCDYYSIYDAGTEIGRIYEDGGDVEFMGQYCSIEQNKRAIYIELKEVYNNKIVLYVPYFRKTISIEA